MPTRRSPAYRASAAAAQQGVDAWLQEIDLDDLVHLWGLANDDPRIPRTDERPRRTRRRRPASPVRRAPYRRSR